MSPEREAATVREFQEQKKGYEVYTPPHRAANQARQVNEEDRSRPDLRRVSCETEGLIPEWSRTHAPIAVLSSLSNYRVPSKL